MRVNVSMDITEIQAFNILLQTLHVDLNDEPPKFEVDEDGEIVCDCDDRGELYLALYHLATKIFPNTEFRHEFNNPNTLMSGLYKESEASRMTIEEKRYKDLQDYFSDKDCAKTILENDDEFKKWIERLKWHVKKCDELAMELKAYREAWEKVEKELKKEDQRFTNKTNFASGYIEGIREALCKINEYRPKEGDTE